MDGWEEPETCVNFPLYLTINISGCTSIPSSFVFSDHNNKHIRIPADPIGSPCQSRLSRPPSHEPSAALLFLSLIYFLSSSSPSVRPLSGASLSTKSTPSLNHTGPRSAL
ncbi:uncharacterized protein APUU_21055S [Aspergillus puulaauensis]|uniref:Uncharacterized protein n=1 Tax=Aspergillus puulaauensis TaxID=1220207 RepID=A0A7R7XG77_9EURO|nr:uncharacterized protein APUU_21055S [Aspergillus puulaauensis]BCS20623.1 hypothetical protein APUU_21055S [Aspergillus puulaauensis]